MKPIFPIVLLSLTTGAMGAAEIEGVGSHIAGNGRSPVLPLPSSPGLNPAKIALGRRLFRDRRLSGHGRISCQSCHDVETNGASIRRFDQGDSGASMRFNTPTVFNSTMNFRFNWQGHIMAASDMITASLRNPDIMGSNGPAIQRLRADAGLNRQVRVIYHQNLDESVVIDALTSYLRSLQTPNARFDRWLRGDSNALSAREKRGWALFQSVGCSSCHQGVNIGGNLFERHGIFHPLASPDPAILRVPSLRNVAVTSPYFHDGSKKDLADAVRSMARAQLDTSLSPSQANDIVAFLRTLDGSYQGQPVRQATR